MVDLKKLRSRLENLPHLETERRLSSRFAEYTKKMAEARKKAQATKKEVDCIAMIFPDSAIDTNVLSLLETCASEAKKIAQRISENPQEVTSETTEKGIVTIREKSDIAKRKCKQIWDKQIDDIVTKWEKIVIAVQRLGAPGGKELREIIEGLRSQVIPQDSKDVEKIKSDLDQLQNGIKKLGLEGSFGRFLERSVESRGASLKDLLQDEIQEKINQFDLWNSFRIVLGR